MIVGLVGVGTMGSRMASRLLDAGHALCLHDVRPEALEPFVARGAVAAGSARAVADRAEVVLSSLPRPETVADAILGPDGVLAGRRCARRSTSRRSAPTRRARSTPPRPHAGCARSTRR